jgi:plasmid maintenance system antidote protein VapI
MENQHPGQLLQQELTKRWLTQKVFADMIGKKISEVNELIKWKRNITVQRDILLSIVFDDPEQKWIKLQNDFDYIVTKANMTQKIQEILSKRKKTKEHEVFEDF